MAQYIIEVSKTDIIDEEEDEEGKKERKKERKVKKEEEKKKKHLLGLEHSPRGITSARGMLQN